MAKILLFSPLFPPSVGGVQSLMEGIAENSNHDIEVLTKQRPEENDERYNFKVHRIDFGGYTGPFKVLKFLLKNARRYDLIYFSRPSSSSKELICRILGKDVISHAHGTELTENHLKLSSNRKFHRTRTIWQKLMFKISTKFVSKFIAVSDWTKDLLLNSGVKDEKIEVIHSAIDFQKYHNPNAKENRKKDSLNIVTVSRLHPVKNHKLVIEALEFTEDVDYTIIGNGPSMWKLKKKVDRKGLQDRVKFKGEITSNLEEHYHKQDVFVMPSEYEAFPVSFLEANAAGLPCISSKAGGIPSAIKEKKTGFMVDPEPKKIAEKINELKSPELRKRMSDEAIKWAKKHDWSIIVPKIDREISEIANS
jgi:phosphatidylinositol alpha-1,6-mannosyltransferase